MDEANLEIWWSWTAQKIFSIVKNYIKYLGRESKRKDKKIDNHLSFWNSQFFFFFLIFGRMPVSWSTTEAEVIWKSWRFFFHQIFNNKISASDLEADDEENGGSGTPSSTNNDDLLATSSRLAESAATSASAGHRRGQHTFASSSAAASSSRPSEDVLVRI